MLAIEELLQLQQSQPVVQSLFLGQIINLIYEYSIPALYANADLLSYIAYGTCLLDSTGVGAISLMQKTKKPFLVKALVTHPKAPIKGWICDQTNSSFLSIGHNTILAKAPA